MFRIHHFKKFQILIGLFAYQAINPVDELPGTQRGLLDFSLKYSRLLHACLKIITVDCIGGYSRSTVNKFHSIINNLHEGVLEQLEAYDGHDMEGLHEVYKETTGDDHTGAKQPFPDFTQTLWT